jgi:hypothetical protein
MAKFSPLALIKWPLVEEALSYGSIIEALPNSWVHTGHGETHSDVRHASATALTILLYALATLGFLGVGAAIARLLT